MVIVVSEGRTCTRTVDPCREEASFGGADPGVEAVQAVVRGPHCFKGKHTVSSVFLYS